jgi:hypothetical protein
MSMLELAATLSIYVSFALLYAANPERLPSGWAPGRGWGAWTRVAALGGVLLAVGLFGASGGEGAASLVVLSAFMTVTTVFIMLVSLWPRGMWALALLSPPVIVSLVTFGMLMS